MKTCGDVVWRLESRDYPGWTSRERVAVKEFLHAHDVHPSDVPIGGHGTSIVARVTGDGSYELELWVMDREDDGKPAHCPHCPACVKQTRVTRAVVTAFPAVSTAWVAEAVG